MLPRLINGSNSWMDLLVLALIDSLTTFCHLHLVNVLNLLKAICHTLINIPNVVLVNRQLLDDLLLVRNGLLFHFLEFVGHLIFHKLFHIAKLLLRAVNILWRNENECFERIIQPIRLDDLLNQEVELLLLLVQEAGSQFLDTFVSHTDFSDQKVEKHDLHNENIGKES